MTVALHDVLLLSRLLHACPDISDPSRVSSLLKQWHWSRKPLSSTINILSVALYDLFGAEGVPVVLEHHLTTHPLLLR